MVMYKIDRRGGVQKSYTRTDPNIYSVEIRLITSLRALKNLKIQI